MPKTFYTEGNTGKSYICEGTDAAASYLTPTESQISSLYFHSDLSYLGSARVISGTITHPERVRSSETNDSKGGSYTYYKAVHGSTSYLLGSHSFGAIRPFIALINNAQISNGIIVQSASQSIRSCSLYMTNSEIRVYENYTTFDDSLPAISIAYKVYIFETLFTGSGSQSVYITPTVFKAGFGKLSSDYKYIRKNTAAPDIYLTAAKTADVSGGGVKVTSPNGTTAYSSAYTGSFQASIGIGIQI